MRPSHAFFLACAILPACNASAPSEDPEDGFVVPDGKEDDFLSVSSSEYVVEGRSTVTVEAGEGRDRALELVRLKHVAIDWFLNASLVDTEDDTTGKVSGFGAMVASGKVEDIDLRQLDERTWEFDFHQFIAGKKNLPRRLGVDGLGRFDVQIGKPSNEDLAKLDTNHEWYRDAPWDPWKPDEVAADKQETLSLTLRVEPGSSDAWFDYAGMIEDDTLSIDVHFGWDYHDDFHLKHSRQLYSWLKRRGFDSPVTDFDELGRASGALTRTIEANDRDVEVAVRIFYGKPGSDTDPDTDAGGKALEADLRSSMQTSDVIIYAGHSGSFYGFALANWRKTDEGDFDDSEMHDVQMPADKYQLVVAEGCDTLMVGPALLANKFKQGKNIDVLTTTSFSNAADNVATTFIGHLIELDSGGRHRPRTIQSLLLDLDSSAMYGVHGVDDDPHLHPYADVDALCESCSSNTDCGGAGNACIGVGDSGRRCAAACTDDSGCPDGFACRSVASASSSTIFASMCVPESLSCE